MGNCTPGPWKIAGGLSEHSASIDIYSESGLWVGVAHGCHDKTKTCGCPGEEVPGFPTDEEAVANARLIALSPEMLKALKGLLHPHETEIERSVAVNYALVVLARAEDPI